MYVCVCHGIRCRDVREAVGKGMARPDEVFRHFAVEPQCGRCVETMCNMIEGEGENRANAFPGLSAVEEPCGACGHRA